MSQGHLFVISAASGAGKTSLVRAMLAQDPILKLSVSHTTRSPRPGEEDGIHYHFVSEAAFLDILDTGGFLESAHVHSARYGTAQSEVENALAAGRDVILEIDWQGAQQIRTLFPNVTSIFILPPSIEALAHRLNNRGQDSEAVIAQRLAASREEMRHVHEFDYVTINDNFDVALQDLMAIVRAQRLLLNRQVACHASLIQSLTWLAPQGTFSGSNLEVLMARITVDDCLDNIPNRFQLTLVAAYRARQLANGSDPLVSGYSQKDKATVLALREIAAGKIGVELLQKKGQA